MAYSIAITSLLSEIKPPDKSDKQHKQHEVNMSKFIKGQSGNPSGRPVGITKTTEIRQQLENGSDGIIKKLIEMAESGDIDAIKMVMDRIFPAPKATAQTISMPSLDTNQELHGHVLREVMTGNIPIETGVQALGFIERFRGDIKKQKLDKDFED